MTFVEPSSVKAREVREALVALQTRFAQGLLSLEKKHGAGAELLPVSWLRDGGKHGGGWRKEVTESVTMNRASLNVSAIHYDDLPDKRLSSATALSCIVHPQHPLAPSMHMHISWTELRDGKGGWRMMVDLNPSIPVEEDKAEFLKMLEEVFEGTPEGTLAEALQQGDRYFAIPSLNRHRGVAHAYLEQWNSGDEAADTALAIKFGEQSIASYIAIVDRALSGAGEPTQAQREAQLSYHSLYLFQVLTLDRGTSSGLLVHNQNDVGIMGSLPNRQNRALLRSWVELVPSPQDELLKEIVHTLEDAVPSVLTVEIRARLAEVVRGHYQRHPEALKLQARGNVLPPTVANHGSRSTASEEV